MSSSLRLAAACLFAIASLFAPPTGASPCDGDGGADDAFIIGVVCQEPGGSTPGGGGGATSDGGTPYVAYRWASICAGDPMVPGGDLDCAAALTCPDPAERLWQLWGQVPNGSWQTLRTGCFGGVPPAFVPPTVTPAHVLSALRRVGLPELRTRTQPEGRTLVNFDTIFFTDPRRVALDLVILNQAVRVEAQPVRYLWHFGDGSRRTTVVPGAPYPRKTITHRYDDAHVTVRPYVVVTYSARFRVGAGAWQDITQTVATTGPSTPLRIVEGTALLSGEHD